MMGDILEETLEYWLLENIPEGKYNKELFQPPTEK